MTWPWVMMVAAAALTLCGTQGCVGVCPGASSGGSAESCRGGMWVAEQGPEDEPDAGPVITRTDCGSVLPSFQLYDTLTIPVDGRDVASRRALADGVSYRLRAAGTAVTGLPHPSRSDAEYAAFNTPADACWPPARTVDIGLSVDVPRGGTTKTPRWGDYSPSHLYVVPFTGKGQPISVRFNDCDYSDNSDQTLTVEVYEPCPR